MLFQPALHLVARRPLDFLQHAQHHRVLRHQAGKAPEYPGKAGEAYQRFFEGLASFLAKNVCTQKKNPAKSAVLVRADAHQSGEFSGYGTDLKKNYKR